MSARPSFSYTFFKRAKTRSKLQVCRSPTKLVHLDNHFVVDRRLLLGIRNGNDQSSTLPIGRYVIRLWVQGKGQDAIALSR